MGPTLFPWHREFLLLFENALRQAAAQDPAISTQFKNLSLPYWDWSSQPSTDAVFSPHPTQGFGLLATSSPIPDPSTGFPVPSWRVTTGRFGAPPQSAPADFNPWPLTLFGPSQNNPDRSPYLTRRGGSDPAAPTLPSASDVALVVTRPFYDHGMMDATSDPSFSLRNYVEGFRIGMPSQFEMYCTHTSFDAQNPAISDEVDGYSTSSTVGLLTMHNRVHAYVAGRWNNYNSFGAMIPNTSPNDPVFFLHHAFIDRLWSDWMLAHPASVPYLPQPGALDPSGRPFPSYTYGNVEMLTWNRLRDPQLSPYQGPEVPRGSVAPNAVSTLGPYATTFIGVSPVVRYCSTAQPTC